jgi:alkanesulfonate monooxygenase SsuD/methylene tetrahydromethanopterin reductase-like flavin-dependent oxidoreductase (luciferase family)
MRFGLYLDGRKPDTTVTWSRHYAEILEVCEQAEAAGADSVWLTEHHRFPDGYLPQPLTFAAAIAARTTRMRIGTGVLLAPLRNTVHLAEEAAVVDILSDGRLDLGLGAGYLPYEFEMFGVSSAKPLHRMFEQVVELRRIYEGGAITPLPVQRPLPIWVGSQGPLGARRAGRLGAPLLSIRQDQVTPYLEGLAEGGFDDSTARMSGLMNVFLTDDPERDREEICRSYGYLWDSYAASASHGHNQTINAPSDMDEALRLGLAGGTNGLTIATPGDAAELLKEYLVGIPVETIYTWAMPPGIPTTVRDRHIELWTGILPGLMKERK